MIASQREMLAQQPTRDFITKYYWYAGGVREKAPSNNLLFIQHSSHQLVTQTALTPAAKFIHYFSIAISNNQ